MCKQKLQGAKRGAPVPPDVTCGTVRHSTVVTSNTTDRLCLKRKMVIVATHPSSNCAYPVRGRGGPGAYPRQHRVQGWGTSGMGSQYINISIWMDIRKGNIYEKVNYLINRNTFYNSTDNCYSAGIDLSHNYNSLAPRLLESVQG